MMITGLKQVGLLINLVALDEELYSTVFPTLCLKFLLPLLINLDWVDLAYESIKNACKTVSRFGRVMPKAAITPSQQHAACRMWHVVACFISPHVDAYNTVQHNVSCLETVHTKASDLFDSVRS
jgi:hypothetical protein